MKIIIIGGRATGLALARLMGEEHEMTIIEQDEKIAEEIANETPALVINGDGSDINVLKEAGLLNADAMITTVDDKTNLMICQIAKTQNVPKIITLVEEPKNEELFVQLGIQNLVLEVGIKVTAVQRLLYRTGDARIIAQIGGGEIQIAELAITESSKLVGKKVGVLKNANVGTIYRAGELIIPKEDTELQEGDVAVVILKSKDLDKITDLFAGE